MPRFLIFVGVEFKIFLKLKGFEVGISSKDAFGMSFFLGEKVARLSCDILLV